MAWYWWTLIIYWFIGGVVVVSRNLNGVYSKMCETFPQMLALPVWLGKSLMVLGGFASGGIVFPQSVYGMYLSYRVRKLEKENKCRQENLKQLQMLTGVLKDLLEEKYGK
jgi:hypothetical protein